MLSPVSRAVVAAAMALALGVAAGERAHAQGQGQGLKLQRSLGPPANAKDAGSGLPTFVIADHIEGLSESEVEATGNAELRRGDTTLFADRIQYFQDSDEAEATGNVRLRKSGDEITGPRLRLRLDDSQGIFEHATYHLAPRYRALQTGIAGPALTATERAPQVLVEGRGDAQALRLDGENRYRATDGTFTTCKPGQDDWLVEAGELDLDMDRQVGTARDARLSFLGVSTPRVPWFNFSLNNERKSGLLAPTFGVQSKSGAEVVLPFYWNIAPNYDATIATRYMAKRGVQFLNEFRFLQPTFVGEAHYEVLPKDEATGTERWATALNTNWNPQNGWSGLINYQAVSDDNYFRDLSGRLSIATQTYLPQQAIVNYGAGFWNGGLWSASLNYQRFQTLQDPENPVSEPYFREPQFTINALKQTVGGMDAAFVGEFVNFGNASLVPTGLRTTAYPSLSLPLIASYGYFTPKVGVSATYYDLTTLGTLPDATLSRTLPIASVDTGLFFDRDANWFGTDYRQTFEPRLYYLYVPFKDQSQFPVFDTSTSDFNFSQLFQENIFAGGDRIANANQLSVAATSRLIRPSDGQEMIRAVVGQRYYFTDQLVFIPGQPVRTDSISPLILGLSGRVAPSWTAQADMQYQFGASEGIARMNVGARYSPAPASVASVSYHFAAANQTAGAGEINTVDVAAQWPLGRGFYGLGRYSYDIVGRKAVEQLLGVEYNAGCWIIRAVAHQFQTATAQQTTLFYIQLELNGFARIGTNPFDVLRRTIPGYSLINQATPENGAPDSGLLGGGGTLAPSAGPAVTLPGAPSGAPGAYK